MTPENEARIAARIDEAVELVGIGADRAAAAAFALVRQMCVSLADPDQLANYLERHTAPLIREREQYRTIAGQRRRSAPRHLVILADSLGLPRPDKKASDEFGAEDTYQLMVMDELPDHDVQSLCQRYFTTQDVLELLRVSVDLGADADVLVHIGLNDCANRIFLEDERLSLDLLRPETKEKIVGFGQRNRRMLLRCLPSHHYVPPDEFGRNLESIAQLLRERGANKIVLSTIILPPARFWAATPGVNRNFAHYNFILMDVVSRMDLLLLDIDRHVWERQHESVLLDDGMHLTKAGHRLFADQLASIIG